MAAKELVEYVAKSLVDDPDAVKVEVVEEDGATVIELHVAEDDMGKVIGRNGSVAKALRTLLKVTAARDGEPVQLEIVCRGLRPSLPNATRSRSSRAYTGVAAPSASRS
jgi:predicted RNA-binding protein YlqC (UPF0109 family)